jgi:DNA polymerase V
LLFSDLLSSNLTEYSQEICRKILKWTGIPVSIGIAPTKTLAKAANERAKKDFALDGVLDMTKLSNERVDKYLDRILVGDVWGVGRQYSKKLRSIGINSAKDLKYADLKWMRKKMTVMGEKCVLELRGIPCFDLDSNPEPQKGIATTRTFGRDVSSKQHLREAIASYVAIAAEKLRSQNSKTNVLTVFVRTNRFKGRYYSNSHTIKLPGSTSSTIELTRYALECLDQIYKFGYKYKQSGVFLTGIEQERKSQMEIFSSEKSEKKQGFLMKTIDEINKKWGRGSLKLASEGIDNRWFYTRTKLSKRYTTSWEELLTANSK